MFNFDAGKFWIDFVTLCAVALSGIYKWWVNKGKAATKEIEHASEQRQALANRMDMLEQRIENLPSDRDIERVHNRIDKIGNQLSEISGALISSGRVLEQINQYLISRERKE